MMDLGAGRSTSGRFPRCLKEGAAIASGPLLVVGRSEKVEAVISHVLAENPFRLGQYLLKDRFEQRLTV